MIPTFPDFKLLEISDREEIQHFINTFGPYSDYNFFSLWTYNTEEDLLISRLHNNLVIVMRNYLTNEKTLSFFGNTNIEETIETLFNYARTHNLHPTLQYIPHASVHDFLHNTKFSIIEDRDNFDYILSVVEHKNLQGKKWHTHKNFVNRFQRLYPTHQVKELDLLNPHIQQEVRNIIKIWQEKKGTSAQDALHEEIAINRALTSAQHFTLLALGLYHDDHLIGFTIADLHHPTYAQTHFTKADKDFQGVFYALYQNLAIKLYERGYKYINHEQDLGIEGLRFAKQQKNPVTYLKKYIILKNGKVDNT